MTDWTKISPREKLSPYFNVGEWTRGVPHSYLNKQKVSPLAPLAVATIFELARIEFNKLIDELPIDERENHPRGFQVSSGVRTPATNRGATKSPHMCGPDFCAFDGRPQGNWKNSAINYDPFYGCFIRALDHVQEGFGLGYYAKSKAGIHIDCNFPLRANQHTGLIAPYYEKTYIDGVGSANVKIPRGHRWGPNGYSWNGNEQVLTSLHTKYHDPNVTPRPWLECAEELNVNLGLGR